MSNEPQSSTATDHETRAAQARTRSEQAITHAAQARTQTEQAITRAAQAETHAAQAGTSTNQAATHLEQAGTRTQQTETQAAQDKTRDAQSETQIAQDKTRVTQSETQARQANTQVIEQALGDSELSYRRLFEAAQDGIFILDEQTGRINDVNPFLVNCWGLPAPKCSARRSGNSARSRISFPIKSCWNGCNGMAMSAMKTCH